VAVTPKREAIFRTLKLLNPSVMIISRAVSRILALVLFISSRVMGALGMIVSSYKNNNVNITVLLRRIKETFISDHPFVAFFLTVDGLSSEFGEFLAVWERS
jgi:hypothetical protein